MHQERPSVGSLGAISFGLRSMFCRDGLQVREPRRYYSERQYYISRGKANNADSIIVGTLVASPGGVFGHSSNNPNCSSVSTAGPGASGVRARSTLVFFSGFSSERPKRGISKLQGKNEMRREGRDVDRRGDRQPDGSDHLFSLFSGPPPP